MKCILLLAAAAAPLLAQPDRLEWFRHDKFGMFIHWGPYSMLAGEWKGRRIVPGDNAEWIMQRFNIPVRDYREMAHGFNPGAFDAGAIARLARAAGMKYVVLTAKHHDGFAMYRSRVSPYNIADWTPFHRDPVQELSDACKKEGIRFGVYYSHREDWDHPDGYGNHWDYDPAKKDFERYLREKSLPQMRELLTDYKPLALIWFDRGLYTRAQALEFVKLVRELQPGCLINGRVGNYAQELLGDYQSMSDNGMPAGGLEEYWETPQTLNHTWGYSRFDQDWKTPAGVIQRLVEIVSKGGNYLLNIGPMGDGTVPPATVAVLEAVGGWMRRNGESIYGTSACPLPELPWGRCTVSGNKVYLHAFARPADGLLRLSGLENDVRRAYRLGGQALEFSKRDGVLTVKAGAPPWDEFDTVVVLELSGAPRAVPPTVVQDSDGPFQLDYRLAVTTGGATKRFNRGGGYYISGWTGPRDACEWHLLVSQPGRYRALISYASPSAGGRYTVRIGNRMLERTVEATGEGYGWKQFELGVVELEKAGPLTVRLSGASPMYFQQLTLAAR